MADENSRRGIQPVGVGDKKAVDDVEHRMPDQVEDEQPQGQVQRRSQHGEYETARPRGRESFNIFKVAESAMQSFRLPGTSRLVVDKRKSAEEGRDKANKADEKRAEKRAVAEGELEIKEGKAQKTREKSYENYLGERRSPVRQEQQIQRSERPLSNFEKLVIERFENSQELEQALKGENAKFAEKTPEQWREFFSKFEGRTQFKKTDLAEISEFLFRGVVKKGDSGKAVMITDIILKSGVAEKFARIGLLYQKIAEFVSKLVPGDQITKQQLADALFAEQLAYLALNPPSTEAELAAAAREKMGIFARESTEAWISSELGINAAKKEEAEQRAQSARKGRRKKSGFFGGLFSGEDDLVESGGQGVGWWSWGRLDRARKSGVKKAVYSFVLIIFVLLCLFLIDRFLVGK